MTYDLEQFSKDYPYTTELKVLWGDMDALRHVNNVTYYRYFEHLRTEFFYTLIGAIETPDFGPVVAESGCRFLSSLTYPDTITLGLAIEHIGSTSVIHNYGIYSSAQQRLAATGHARMVNINIDSGQKTPLPDKYREILSQYQVAKP